MDDVVGHVVLAIGDEDLASVDAIGAVGLLFGAGAQRADVGAGGSAAFGEGLDPAATERAGAGAPG